MLLIVVTRGRSRGIAVVIIVVEIELIGGTTVVVPYFYPLLEVELANCPRGIEERTNDEGRESVIGKVNEEDE